MNDLVPIYELVPMNELAPMNELVLTNDLMTGTNDIPSSEFILQF